MRVAVASASARSLAASKSVFEADLLALQFTGGDELCGCFHSFGPHLVEDFADVFLGQREALEADVVEGDSVLVAGGVSGELLYFAFHFLDAEMRRIGGDESAHVMSAEHADLCVSEQPLELGVALLQGADSAVEQQRVVDAPHRERQQNDVSLVGGKRLFVGGLEHPSSAVEDRGAFDGPRKLPVQPGLVDLANRVAESKDDADMLFAYGEPDRR